MIKYFDLINLWIFLLIILHNALCNDVALKREVGNRKQCSDGCSRSPFCTHEDLTADPYDCGKYHLCLYGEWVEQYCGMGTYFDSIACDCLANLENCLTCRSTLPRTTMESAPCPGIPFPCEEGQKYPDQSDCESYYPCINGELYVKTKCEVGAEHGMCITVGAPCAFDIYLSQCVNPDHTFDCETRCRSYTTTPITSLCNADPCDRAVPCIEGEITADPENCDRFQRCSRGLWVTMDCPPSHLFDSTSCECIKSEQVHCHVCNAQINVYYAEEDRKKEDQFFYQNLTLIMSVAGMLFLGIVMVFSVLTLTSKYRKHKVKSSIEETRQVTRF